MYLAWVEFVKRIIILQYSIWREALSRSYRDRGQEIDASTPKRSLLHYLFGNIELALLTRTIAERYAYPYRERVEETPGISGILGWPLLNTPSI